MAIKYDFVLILGAVVLALLIAGICVRPKKRGYLGGRKIANTKCVAPDMYFARRMRIYKVCSRIMLGLCALSIAACFLLAARPYTNERTQDEKYARDIILCIDISTSVDYLNQNLIDKLKDTVDEMAGERFGIVIFNTSPVMLTPLTDDYEYVKDQLDEIEKSLEMRNGNDMNYIYSSDYDWIYYYQYISSGTLVGNETRGSSLIGDGLAAAAGDFPDLEEDEDRTRVIIFSTDNDIQGEPIATLDEAASICVDNNVTVYGVGTKEMTAENKESMKKAVESTGGQFFLEEESGSFSQIVTAIEDKSKSLVKVSDEVRQTAWLKAPFALLLSMYAAMLVMGKILKL